MEIIMSSFCMFMNVNGLHTLTLTFLKCGCQSYEEEWMEKEAVELGSGICGGCQLLGKAQCIK